jgi:hypothetical protein
MILRRQILAVKKSARIFPAAATLLAIQTRARRFNLHEGASAKIGMLVAYQIRLTARMIGCRDLLPAAENPFKFLE